MLSHPVPLNFNGLLGRNCQASVDLCRPWSATKQLIPRVCPPTDEHSNEPPYSGNVFRRITVNEDEISDLTLLHRPEFVIHSQTSSGVEGGRTNGLDGGKPGLD